ncbi:MULTISPECIES: TY-Chap domain-containing protein [unclassified Nocardioides]|uniref:TY-Chap domain-containing protein n=1 Tax=unclassified Nocardioides TaxID=2615069 RepID=UPI0007033177|nr:MULTISPECIES: hypothetical protein [unclassified Nocardioides]KRC48801.1 hypothetical protein ASE19_17930 [Nocardioides sp. Root79]KRC75200.1 hypothetical protein ASE20_19830 [Nocardioides sp. Root240]
MTNPSHGGTPADETCSEAWSAFEVLLGDHLATMLDVEDHLIVEIPDGGASGTAPYAQFAGCGDGSTVHGEVTSNAYLGAAFLLDEDEELLLDDAGFVLADDDGTPANWSSEEDVTVVRALASRVVFALRQVFGIAHPHLMTYQAWGPAASGARRLGLCPTADVPVEGEGADQAPRTGLRKTAYKPKTRARLLRLVGRALEERYGVASPLDDDEDYLLRHLDQPVWVRVRQDQPAVEILARVTHDVRSLRGTAVEIGILNRDHLWVKWELRDRAVFQTLVVPGFPFAPLHLAAMLDVFEAAMTATRDDLALRVGGRTA